MKKISIYLLFCFVFTSCASQDKENIAGQYNNKGTDLMLEARDQDDELKRKELLTQAILYFDSSISINPTMVNYGNKIKTQCQVGAFDQALSTIHDSEKNGVTPESTTMKGFILERIGKVSEANKLYLEAITLYTQRIPNSKDPVSDKLNIAFLKAFTENLNSAKKEIRKIEKENPKSNKIEVIKETIDHFDRKEFINDLGN